MGNSDSPEETVLVTRMQRVRKKIHISRVIKNQIAFFFSKKPYFLEQNKVLNKSFEIDPTFDEGIEGDDPWEDDVQRATREVLEV